MTDKQWTLEELTLTAEERWRFEARAAVATIVNDAYVERTGQQIADDRWLDEVTAKIAEVMWTAESSRRDWAAEAMRLEMELEAANDALHDESCWREDMMSEVASLNVDRPLAKTARRYRRERDEARELLANAGCSCISDDQATHLGPGFSRPVCAVHPSEEV